MKNWDMTEKEKEIWKLFTGSPDSEADLMEMLITLHDKGWLEEVEKEDLILYLSGVDEGASDRRDARREYIKMVKNMIENTHKDRERALKALKDKKGSFSRSV